MIGFSIMTWFIAVIMIGLSISLLKGNYTFVHGNVFDRTKDKAGYAKKLGSLSCYLQLELPFLECLQLHCRRNML